MSIARDIYYESAEYLVNNYTLKNLKEYCEDRMNASGNKIQLSTRIKEYYDNDKYRQTLAHTVVSEMVNDILERIKSKEEFEIEVSNIDDNLIFEAYRNYDSVYVKENILKTLYNLNMFSIYETEEYWNGKEFIVNEGDLLLECGEISIIKDDKFYNLSKYKYKLNSEIDKNNIQKLDKYEPFNIYVVKESFVGRLIDTTTENKGFYRYKYDMNNYTSECVRYEISSRLEVTMREV